MLEAGYSCRDVVLVGSGRIRTFIVGESGREVTLYYVQAGESCPVNLGAAMLGIGAFANARASGRLVGATIPARDFRDIGSRNDALQDYLFSATVLRFGEVTDRVREITMRRIDHRLAEYLLRKFDESAESPPAAKVTQQDIALDLGTAREVVSRRLHELDGAGAVELRRGKIILQDRVALTPGDETGIVFEPPTIETMVADGIDASAARGVTGAHRRHARERARVGPGGCHPVVSAAAARAALLRLLRR